MTFSFSVKGSEEGVPVVATVVDGRGKVTSHSVDATDKWSRHSFAATPGDDIAFVTPGFNAGEDLPLPVAPWAGARPPARVLYRARSAMSRKKCRQIFRGSRPGPVEGAHGYRPW